MRDDVTRDLMLLREEAASFVPAPVADVRQRGDALRRRRQAVVAGAAAVAAAAVIAPAAWLALPGHDSAPPVDTPTPTPTRTDPTPDPSPSPTPSTEATAGAQGSVWGEIPSGFPLAAGWPSAETDADIELRGPAPRAATLDGQVIAPCDGTFPTADATAELSATWRAPEDGRFRQLLLFADGPAARRYAADLREVFASCPGGTYSGDQGVAVTVTPAPDGYLAGLGQTVRGEPAVGVTVLRVARVGNRVVLAASSSEGSDPAVAGEQVEQQLAEVLRLVRADRPPAADDGSSGSVEPGGEAAAGIPAGFPLDAEIGDWTGDGGRVRGPSATAPGVELTWCGEDVWVDAPDRLAVRSTGPEIGDFRELRVWRTADEAVAMMSRLRTLVGDCPTDATAGGPADRVVRTHPADTGYADTVSFAVTMSEGLGGEVFQFTRVGRSVVAVSRPGEMLTENAGGAVTLLTPATRRLTPEMCVFTEAGC